jgi:hypothetical protein
MQVNKFRQLMFDVSDEILDKFEDFENRSQIIDPKVKKLHDKLSNYFKDKCYTQFEWLEKHGNVFENDKDFAIRINKRQVDKNKAEKAFVDFHECCSKNDFGIRNYFSNVLEAQDNLKLSHSNCLQNCRLNKNEGDAKVCIKECFVNTINRMNLVYDDVTSHLEDYDKKI